MDKTEILNRLAHLQKQIEEIRGFLLDNKVDPFKANLRKQKNMDIHEYQLLFTWEQKIVFIIRYQNRPLLSSEIVSFLDDFDTVFQYKHFQIDKLKMLSTHLRRAVEKKAITRFKKPGIKGYFYELPEVVS